MDRAIGVHGRRSVRDRIVLVGPKLAAFLGLVLETLLLRSIGVADLQWKLLLTDWLPVELLDDLIAFLPTSESVCDIRFSS